MSIFFNFLSALLLGERAGLPVLLVLAAAFVEGGYVDAHVEGGVLLVGQSLLWE